MTNTAPFFSARWFAAASLGVLRRILLTVAPNRTTQGILLSALLFSACAIPPTKKEIEARLPTEYVPLSELSVAVLAQQGLAAFKGNRFGEAVLRYTQAIERANSDKSISDDDIIGLERNLAVALNSWGLPEEGVKRLQNLAERLPRSATLRFALANALHSANRDEQAMAQYEEAIRLLRHPEEATPQNAASAIEEQWNEAELMASAAADKPKIDWSSIATIARTAAAVAYKSGNEEKARCLSELAFQLANNRADLLAHGAILLATGRPEEVRPAVEKLFPAPAFGPDAAVLALVAQAELALGNVKEFALLARNAERAGMLSLEDRIILTKLFFWIPEEDLVVGSALADSLDNSNGAANEQGAAMDAGGASSTKESQAAELETILENPFVKDKGLLDASVISGSPSANFDMLRSRFDARSGD